MAGSASGREALGYIDQALSEKPAKNDHALSQATMCLADLRDGIVARGRRATLDADGLKYLAHLNAVITVVLGIHFPLGDVPWSELEKARNWLAEIVDADVVRA